MRRSKFFLASALLALVLLICGTNNTRAQGRYAATYQDFYDGLAPYGQWIQDPQYGYVWLPDVAADFRPYYTNGYWANTEYGNTWVSDYDWGWAPFHYGRWTYDNYYGWLWIPDTEWAPAWVSWRSSNDYYGWAPMGPGINININLGLIPVDWWMFVTPTYFYDRSFYRYCNYDYRFRRGVYAQTNIINYTYIDNRTTYYTGPRADDYYRSTGRRPSMFNIDNNRRRGATRVSGNRINMYRPSMRNTATAAPMQVVQTDRAVTRRPQVFSGTAEKAKGRETILRQNGLNNNAQTPGRTNGTNPRINEAQQGAVQDQRGMQVQQRDTRSVQQGAVPIQQQSDAQQRLQQVQQREVQQQQRDAQVQQQRVQQAQQREVQIQQQRDVQVQQQRTQQAQVQQQRDMQVQQRAQQAQQREAQIQQQRDMQVQQQRAQQAQMQQQRDMQVQQQREAQIQQQRAQQAQMQQQRDMQVQQQRDQQAQMQQQRVQQAQQRDVQVPQQRGAQIQQSEMQRARPDNNGQSPMRMSRDGNR